MIYTHFVRFPQLYPLETKTPDGCQGYCSQLLLNNIRVYQTLVDHPNISLNEILG